jgi:hypothetical protein
VKHLSLALIATAAIVACLISDLSDMAPSTKQGWNWSSTVILVAVFCLWIRDDD